MKSKPLWHVEDHVPTQIHSGCLVLVAVEQVVGEAVLAEYQHKYITISLHHRPVSINKIISWPINFD